MGTGQTHPVPHPVAPTDLDAGSFSDTPPWTLDDPAGKSVEDVRSVRDEIERRVRGLLDELGVPAA